MGSLLKTSVVVGFWLLLLLPALVYCDRFVSLDLFMDKNCTEGPGIPSDTYTFNATGNLPFYIFNVNPFNASETIQSAILTNVSAGVTSLIACQAGFQCNATGTYLISFNLSDIGACSTAGPPGTQFGTFVLT